MKLLWHFLYRTEKRKGNSAFKQKLLALVNQWNLSALIHVLTPFAIDLYSRRTRLFPADEKSNQWFGATVSSSGQDGVVVVCFYYLLNVPTTFNDSWNLSDSLRTMRSAYAPSFTFLVQHFRGMSIFYSIVTSSVSNCSTFYDFLSQSDVLKLDVLKPDVLWVYPFHHPQSACLLLSTIFFFINIFLGDFFSFLFVQYSALLHLQPLRFHCADRCWDRDRCNLCIGSQTLTTRLDLIRN
jgi:hypothetical protein